MIQVILVAPWWSSTRIKQYSSKYGQEAHTCHHSCVTVSMTDIHGILAQFSQSTRLLHVESFNPELIFLLDHPNNSYHPAPYIMRLITFTLGNIHDLRVELTSNPSPFKTISHVNIIKFYLQYVHSLVTNELININT